MHISVFPQRGWGQRQEYPRKLELFENFGSNSLPMSRKNVCQNPLDVP